MSRRKTNTATPSLISDATAAIPNTFEYRGYTVNRLADLADGSSASQSLRRWEIRCGATGKVVGIRPGPQFCKLAIDLMVEEQEQQQAALDQWADL